MNHNKAYKYATLLGAILGCLYLFYGIFKSTNSTAGIGFLFLPFFAITGGILGYFIIYLIDLSQGNQKLISLKSLFLFSFTGILLVAKIKEYQTQKYHLWIQSPERSEAELRAVLQSKDSTEIGLVAEHPNLSKELLNDLFTQYTGDYFVMSRLVDNPKLTSEQMQSMADNIPSRAGRGADYDNLYQTFVLAKLVKRPDLPEKLFHQIALTKVIGHFLALAIIDSPLSTCQELAALQSNGNQVLENAIYHGKLKKNCK